MAARRVKPRRRTPKRRRNRGGRTGNGFWYLAIAVCIALVVGAFTGSQFLISKNEIDKNTLCHASGALNVTVVLLDLTDPLSETQQSRLKAIIANEISSSSTDTMISIGVVSENPSGWGAKFTKCKPETGEDANALYENPTIIAERYAREFTGPLQTTLASMLKGEPENQSPIMEALQSLISETPGFLTSEGQRKIIVVSDMLQHSENLSFYRGQGWEYFIENNGIQRLARNLTDTAIQIIRIPRSGSNIPSTKTVDDFWSRYFDRQGSHAPTVQPLGDL